MEIEPAQYSELNEDDQRKVFAAVLEGRDILRYFIKYKGQVWSMVDMLQRKFGGSDVRR